MSAIKFTLLVCDSSRMEAYHLRSNREITVIASNLQDAQSTYYSKCPRFEVEFVAVNDATLALFSDLDTEGKDPVHYLVSDAVAKTAFVEEMESFPADCNPFLHDVFSMGTDLVRGWMAMHDGFDRPENQFPLNWLYLVNTRTGRRVRIHLNDRVVQPESQKEGSND